MKLLSTFGFLLCSCTYHYVCCALRSDEFSLSFSAEKVESSEIAVQQILAHVAVRVCMCVQIGENNARVACCGACRWPRSTDNECS